MKHSRQRTIKNEGTKGYSLPEVLIVVVVASILLAAISSSLLTLMRGSAKMADYSVMSGQARLCAQYFRQDIQLATSTSSLSPTGFSLVIPGSGGGFDVVDYLYDDTEKEVYRIFNGFSRLLMNNVKAFQFDYFTVNGFPTTNPIKTKKVAITADVGRGDSLSEKTNNYHVETRAILVNI